MLTRIEQETLTAVRSAAHKYNRDEPNWEQRRYEIAKEVLPVLMRIDYQQGINEGLDSGDIYFETCAEDAIAQADALIKLLKGE